MIAPDALSIRSFATGHGVEADVAARVSSDQTPADYLADPSRGLRLANFLRVHAEEQ